MSDKTHSIATSDATVTLQLVGFTVNGEEFGVDILAVQEIIRMIDITKIPNAPDYVEGIINLRGRVIPVVDFRRRFTMAARNSEKNHEQRIVVVSILGTTIGLMVDRVSQVVNLLAQDISPAPDAVQGVDSAFIRGIGRRENGLLIILNTEKLFQPEHVAAMDRAA